MCTVEGSDELFDCGVLCVIVDVDKSCIRREFTASRDRLVPVHQLEHSAVVLLRRRQVSPTCRIIRQQN